MPRYLTPDAGAITEQGCEHALRLRHPYLGGEHFLLALGAADQPAGAVLREHGPITTQEASHGRPRR